MADNNKNPRRTIWLSETEPLSHYDIWLSKNQHLNSDGEPLSDSGVLRPCDYIFKVWDCDNWYPIIGFNSTAVNKINTVYNTNYTTTHNGHSINSSSYLEFHLPLFTSPNSSPLELFDAGTIGEVIFEYVTELEWQNIFEGDAFNNSFKLYFPTIIHNGDISINELLEPAEANKLGGIWADEFSIEDMFPSLPYHTNYTDLAISESYNWIALAKYKLNHGDTDYNLYVNAKDIINIINNYLEDNPDEPGITPGGGATIDPEVIYRSFYDSPTVLKGWRDDNSNLAWKPRFEIAGARILQNRGRFLKIRNDDWWQTNVDPYSDENNAIEWVDINDYIISAINNNELLVGGNGVTVSYNAPHGDNPQYISLGLAHIQQAIDGAVCRKITSNGLSDIEWTSLDDIYPLLTADSSSDIKYVVKGGSNDKHYLNGNGEWAIPEGTQYTEGPFIKIDNGTIGIKANPANGSWYIRSDSGSLSWASVPEQQEYPTLSPSNHSTGPYVVNGCNESSAAKFFLNGEGGWTEINSGLSELIEGNGFTTFIVLNKIYIGAYYCDIQANDFILDTSVLINVDGTYQNNRYPLTSFVNYLAQYPNGISSIKIESENQVDLPYPSYMHFETSTKCTFTFPKSMEFIETESVNSLSGETYYYTDTDYIIELKPSTKYNVIFYKSCIKFETNSNSIFDTEFNPGI